MDGAENSDGSTTLTVTEADADAMAGQAVKAMKSDMGLPVSLYQSLTDDMVTNLSLDRSVYLATEAMDMHFTADGIVSLKAKSKKGSVYDEVYVDDDALYDLIIQTFYTEEQSEGESK